MKLKYKTGDFVKIKEDLINGEYYGAYYFTKRMMEARGKLFLIRKIKKDSINNKGYNLYDWPDNLSWTDKMIERKIPKSQWTKKMKIKLKKMLVDVL